MAITSESKAPDILEVESVLGREFPDTSAYRYNAASIRVRVVDDQFRGKSVPERERLVRPLIARLPAECQSDITILLLLPPEELAGSLMNLEFENPSPSML